MAEIEHIDAVLRHSVRERGIHGSSKIEPLTSQRVATIRARARDTWQLGYLAAYQRPSVDHSARKGGIHSGVEWSDDDAAATESASKPFEACDAGALAHREIVWNLV